MDICKVAIIVDRKDDEILNKETYLYYCAEIDRLNSNFIFDSPDKNKTLNAINKYLIYTGEPKSMGDEMIATCSTVTFNRYQTLLQAINDSEDPEKMIELVDFLDERMTKEWHAIQYGRTPVCQWGIEYMRSPQLYWCIEAAKKYYQPAFKEEYKYLVKYASGDKQKRDELADALTYKLAYEGDSDVQYDLLDKYTRDPSQHVLFNTPIKPDYRNKKMAEYWRLQLLNNSNIRPSTFVFEALAGFKSECLDKAFERAIELDNPELYIYIANYYGYSSDICLEYSKKVLYNNEIHNKRNAVTNIARYYIYKDRPSSALDILMEFVEMKDHDIDAFRAFEELYNELAYISNPNQEMILLKRIAKKVHRFSALKKFIREHYKKTLFKGWKRIKYDHIPNEVIFKMKNEQM